MNRKQFEEGGVWDAQRRLLIVIRQSDVELRVWGEMTVKECACDFFPGVFLRGTNRGRGRCVWMENGNPIVGITYELA